MSGLTKAQRAKIKRALREAAEFIEGYRADFIQTETVGPKHDLATLRNDALPILDEYDRLLRVVESGRQAIRSAEGK